MNRYEKKLVESLIMIEVELEIWGESDCPSRLNNQENLEEARTDRRQLRKELELEERGLSLTGMGGLRAVLTRKTCFKEN